MSLPHDIGSTVPQYINGSLLDEFLPLSFSRTLGYRIICEKLTGIQLFDEQEGCTKDGNILLVCGSPELIDLIDVSNYESLTIFMQ